MAATDTAGRQGPAPNCTVPSDRLNGVLRTGGQIAATAAGTQQGVLGRGQYPSISQQDRQDDVPKRVHEADSGTRAAGGTGTRTSPESRAWRTAVRKSRSTSRNVLPTIDLRATRTADTGRVNSARWRRNASRSRRLARFRTTAPPIERLATRPTRSWSSPAASAGSQFRIRQP
mgnify:CR=1 FL=1